MSQSWGVSSGTQGAGVSGSRTPLVPSMCSQYSACFLVSLSLCSGMKRPLSPSPPGEKEPPISGATECPPRPPELPKPKRERKRPSYTLCDVCNIQLNSAAQAQVHCGGRAHQRRLRQLSLGKTPTGPGQCGGAMLLQAPSGPRERLWVCGLSLGGVGSWGALNGTSGSEVPLIRLDKPPWGLSGSEGL